jgi:hypothetical protein
MSKETPLQERIKLDKLSKDLDELQRDRQAILRAHPLRKRDAAKGRGGA